MKKIRFGSYAVLGAILLTLNAVQANEVKERIEQPVHQAIATRQATQQSEEKWHQERRNLENTLAALEIKVQHLTTSCNDLKQDVAAATKRIAAKQQQLADIQRIGTEMSSFLTGLVAQLKGLPGEGLPFLPDERRRRLTKLGKIMRDPKIEASEQYRKAMEALLVEAEYGLTIETYQQEIGVDGQAVLANIFRLGRLGLYYQTLDESGCGFFNVASRQWQPLTNGHNQAVRTAVAIAAKQRPAELITIPLGRVVSQ